MTYFNPERMPVLPAARRAAARLQLEELVARSARSRHRSRSAVVATAAAVIILSTGAAAFAVAEFQSVSNKTQARCYTVADLSGTQYTTIAAAGRPGSTAQVQDAVSVCAALFRQGFLTVGGPGVAGRTDGRQNNPVPRLVACTMSNGTAAVFPGDAATCAKLNLPAASKP